jgi:hypothetical protein
MKVYAHFAIENGIEFRWRTLLQFGDSWNTIGTVIMKNPGSADPLLIDIPNEILSKLNQIDNSYEWSEFSDDPTLRLIAKLFEEHYRCQLNGVIQIYNLFNIKDQNLDSALNKLSDSCSSKCFTFEDDIQQLHHPIYIGWGDLWKDIRLKSVAQKYFTSAVHICSDNWYLSSKLDDKDNNYHHPQWLMGQGVHTLSSLVHRAKFHNNTPHLTAYHLHEVLTQLELYPKTHPNAIKALKEQISLVENK